MGSIPLPALDIKTPQQPDMLEKYGQLQALRNNQQQMQIRAQQAPLQQQALQQQVDTGGIQLQQQQQQLKDQQASTAALTEWDGKKIDDLYPLILKNGGSATAVLSLKKQALDQQHTAAETFKNQQDAGKAQVETLKQRNDMLGGALSPLTDPKQIPDDQLPQALQSTVQDLVQKGLLDPQGAQAADQLLQFGDPNAIRGGVKQFINSHMALTQIADNAYKDAQTANEKANTGKTKAEMDYYAKNGGAPGVPIEAQQQADWLSKNPGKGPSDYVAWKAKQSPMALVMGNQLSGQGNSEALDFVAENYRKTGQMPPELSRSPGTITAVIQRAAQMDQTEGGNGIAANKATFTANTDSLKKLQTNFDQVQAFEQTAQKNMDLLQQTAAKIPDLGARFANIPVRMLNSQMLGTENMASFKTALATAQTEAAKVLNSANATGTLSDSSRHELQDIIDGNVPYKSLVASLNTLKQDMANRTQAYQAQIGDIQQRLKGGAKTPASDTTAPPRPAGVPANAEWNPQGNNGKGSWRVP